MDQFVTFLTRYGIGGVVIVFLAFVVTQLVKIPIKRWGEDYAEKRGVDKAVVTRWIFAIPLALAFVGSVLNQWAIGGWGAYICSPDFDWTAVVVETLACASAAGSLYSVVETFSRAKTSQEIADLTGESAKVAEARATIASEAVSASDRLAAERKARKAQLKATRLAEKQARLEAERQAQVERLQAQIAKLQGTSSVAKKTVSAPAPAQVSTITGKAVQETDGDATVPVDDQAAEVDGEVVKQTVKIR